MAEKNECHNSFKRIILITGSTDGIGRQTALELAVRNKENFVIVHGRNIEKCEATIDYIMREGKLPDKSNLDFVVGDFSDLKEVSDLATDVQKRFPLLNVLLCNAGVLLPKRAESRNGLELTFQVNYLAHYILSRSLFSLLKKNVPSRLVLVSSICYEWYSLDWSDLESSKTYEKYTQYSRTKLMIHLMTFKLARLFIGSGVTCNVLEPGIIETKLLRAGGYSGVPVCAGSRSSVFLCTSDSVTNVNGAYYDRNCKRITKLFKDAVDEKQQENLWQLTDKLCEKKDY